MSSSTHETKPILITLMGPTASGKTDLAIALRDAVNGDIVSVDSALVYRGMDIGSAKPSPAELSVAPHRLIDIRDPSEPYSAADFCRDAKLAISDIVRQGRTPLLVGGTMLYFKSLLEGLSDLPEANQAVRREIEEQAERHGWPYMHGLLNDVDPVSAAKIHPNHSQRLARALEVYKVTGQPMSSFQGKLQGGIRDDYRCVQLAVCPRERSLLHNRIALRFDQMLAKGLLDEVRALMARSNLHADLPSMRAVGYRQALEHLRGDYGLDEMREKSIVASRQLAKRQLTWLRSWPEVHWLDTQNEQGSLYSSEQLVSHVLKILDKITI